MKRIATVLVVSFILLVGCGTKPPESSQTPATPTPPGPSLDSHAVPPTAPPAQEQDATATKSMTSQLVPNRNDRYGVSFSYPESLNTPEIPQTGLPALKLDLGNGEISISRDEAKPGKTLADLANENVEANTKASNGRIVSKDLGKQLLGGEEAWEVQRYFDSSAGRYDAIQYFILKGGFEYRVVCGTKQGPPVIPWSAVKPVCQRILETIRFEP